MFISLDNNANLIHQMRGEFDAQKRRQKNDRHAVAHAAAVVRQQIPALSADPGFLIKKRFKERR